LKFLLDPVENAMGPLAVIRPAEAFMNKMKAALVGGIFLALPMVFYQLWRFISPGLYRREKRWVLPVMTAGTALFLAGAAFCYKVAMPAAVGFLASQGKAFKSMVTVDSAFSFSTKLLFGLGLVFEMPLVVFALARLGLVSARFLWRKFDIAIFIIFVVAAVVTPTPDVITQTIFALPMIGLYLISIAVAWFARRKPGDESPARPAGER
jgi:sec-independent protein translocase protein TatC